ncbi:MAG: CpsD/CapB family tyrosine-protein kinase [Mogibacterium sp.]|nr:CpsD/CapB family tyrosine-protein kinase [Mogibacterium sp.]
MVEFGNTPQLPYSVEEAINRLRINISFLGSDVRRIMVVSSEPNEGKTFLALNLWNQMAEAGEKTIMIDADMRNSTLYAKYDLKRTDGEELKGLSHFLSGNASLNEVLVHTKYGHGDLLPNIENVVNPSMLLESSKFGSLLNALVEPYRYIFVDAPPLGMVSDAERIGNMCDGAILCVRSGMTPKGVVKESARQLERAGCPLLGIVLNRVEENKGKYYSKYGRYGRYGRYGKYGGYYSEYYGSARKAVVKKDSKPDK